MKKSDLNTLSMAEAVIAVLNLFIAKIGLAPKLQVLFDLLTGLVTKYHDMNKKMVLENGFASIKQKSRDALTSAADILISQMKLYAAMENDLVTANQLNLYYSDLYKVGGDILADRCTKVADVATALGAKLTGYNVTPVIVTDFRKLIVGFSELLSAPRMDITARAAIKKEMENIIREIRALLNDKMDLSMNSIKKSEPEFFNAYTSARVIVDRKGKRIAKQPDSDTTGMISGTLTDSETGDPIADAIVQLEGTDEATTTDEDGEFIFDTVAAGQANVVCIKELYKNLNLSGVVVKAGEETEVEGVMEKES